MNLARNDGSYDNYEFLNQNNIENYVKYFTFDGNVSGRNPYPYYLEDNGSLRCLNGNIGYKTDIDNRHPKLLIAFSIKSKDVTYVYLKNTVKDI